MPEPPSNPPTPFIDPVRQIWLHVHVPKAGGSTLRQLMNRNFGDSYYNSKSLLETKQYTREDVSEIVRCHPWVRCLSDHKLSMDLPYDHDFCQVHSFSFVRDPIERFVSRYFFHRHFEEVNCIAQRMSFREFANAELVQQDVHPQTNSQIYFLNGGRSFDDLTIVNHALSTEKAFLFPIERFDEACICLERLFPTSFSDLSYVRTNVSKKDAPITDEDRELAMRHLKHDYPVFELANQFLDQTLARTFNSNNDRESALAEFKDRCGRRYHNFYPPVGKGEPLPPIGSEPAKIQPDVTPSSSTPLPSATPSKPVEPMAPKEPAAPEKAEQPVKIAEHTVSENPTIAMQPVVPESPKQTVASNDPQPTLDSKPNLQPKTPVKSKPKS